MLKRFRFEAFEAAVTEEEEEDTKTIFGDLPGLIVLGEFVRTVCFVRFPSFLTEISCKSSDIFNIETLPL